MSALKLYTLFFKYITEYFITHLLLKFDTYIVLLIKLHV